METIVSNFKKLSHNFHERPRKTTKTLIRTPASRPRIGPESPEYEGYHRSTVKLMDLLLVYSIVKLNTIYIKFIFILSSIVHLKCTAVPQRLGMQLCLESGIDIIWDFTVEKTALFVHVVEN
jgi:hypothetical protein